VTYLGICSVASTYQFHRFLISSKVEFERLLVIFRVGNRTNRDHIYLFMLLLIDWFKSGSEFLK